MEFWARADWFEGHQDRLARYVDAFTQLCEATDAFFGYISWFPFNRQRMALINNGIEDGRIPPDRDGSLGRDEFVSDSLYVLDVFWTQYYGPSYVAKWGKDALDGMGVRRRWTSNGGIVITATETPFELDPLVEGLSGYGWKQPFYDALGPDTFLSEGMTKRGPGEVVPTYYDHAAHLKHGPSESTADVIAKRLDELHRENN